MIVRRWLLLACVPAFVVPASARADIGATGPEFQVNTYTTSYQSAPGVCRGANGDFVVTWQGAPDPSTAVAAQRFAADGTRRGTEFVVNTYTTLNQDDPAVCCDAAGNFVVAWESFQQDGDVDGIFAQRWAADGNPQGTEFRVSVWTTGDQFDPTICCDPTGAFVVGWSDSARDGNGFGVFARRFASDGTPQAPEFQVNTFTTGAQTGVDVACDPAGGFAVAWTSAHEGSGLGVFAQRYSSDGAVGTEFQVNAYTTMNQERPALCTGPNGELTIAWQSIGQDGSVGTVVARRFGSGGTPASDEFQVNTYTSGPQFGPDVECDGAGDFTVAWSSYAQDGALTAVVGRRYGSAGTPLGPEFIVNTYTTGYQNQPAVAADRDGDFVVAWASQQDGGMYGIFAQRFADPCGDGVVGAGEACDDGSRIDGPCCAASCQFAAAGTPCESDGVGCTDDACSADVCTHTARLAACPACRLCDPTADCVAGPRPDCRRPTKSRKASLALTNKTNDRRDALAFTWQKGAATALADFGTPTAAGDYTLCVFDRANGADRLVLESRVPAGGGWKARGKKGFVYRSRTGAVDGITRVDLKPGAAGKAQFAVQGKGVNLGLPVLGLAPPVTAQLESGERATCFGAELASPSRNTGATFRARGQ
jgi:hypothetical protein